MVVGTVVIDINLPGVDSLKEKRKRLKSLLARLRNKFNIAVAEVDFNDVHRRAQIGIAVVSNDRRHADRVLAGAVRLIEGEPELVITDYRVEML